MRRAPWDSVQTGPSRNGYHSLGFKGHRKGHRVNICQVRIQDGKSMSGQLPRLRALRPRPQQHIRSNQLTRVQINIKDKEEEKDSDEGDTCDAKDSKDSIQSALNIDDSDEEGKLVIKTERDSTSSEELSISKTSNPCKSPESLKTLANRNTYNRYIKNENKQKVRSYKCPHCDFICQHSQKLQRHFRLVHENRQDVMADSSTRTKCLVCSHVATSAQELETHQKAHHLKRRFFRCVKCSYVTHVRARYTKHVKYHSMPLIKCNSCDFRTPYKWNLDRHTRNHGGDGAFQCHACNFTADIRQSLTVHETNHHEPPIGQPHRKVGASDFRNNSESPGSSSPGKDSIGQVINMPEMSESTSEAECIALKCEEKGCQFITAWDSEMQRHLMESHAPNVTNKPKKPLPKLIPLDNTDNAQRNDGSIKDSPGILLQVPKVRVRPELAHISKDMETSVVQGRKEVIELKRESGDSFEKRNASFFDKLKERLMLASTSPDNGTTKVSLGSVNDLKCWCTFEASNFEELANHKRSHHAALSVSVSTSRCPKCRRRCKSSVDLQVHMRLCHSGSGDASGSTDNDPWSKEYRADYAHPFQVDWEANYGGFGSSGPLVEDGPTNLSTRRVFKCPHCPFWASTASRFHVHIVGHLNRKPFECSLCAYRSNWRWDITKHIKLKAARDPAHTAARVLMTDETGRRNYSKYNKYLAEIEQQATDERISENQTMEDIGIEEPPSKVLIVSNSKKYSRSIELAAASTSSDSKHLSSGSSLPYRPVPSLKTATRSQGQSLLKSSPSSGAQVAIGHVPTSTPKKNINSVNSGSSSSSGNSSNSSNSGVDNNVASTSVILSSDIPAASANAGSLSSTSGTITVTSGSSASSTLSPITIAVENTKRTLWKCKRCNFRDSNKENVLFHVKSHYESVDQAADSGKNAFGCGDCPFSAPDSAALALHRVHHRPNLEAIFKCYLCPYYVSTKAELLEHARLHGEELAVVHQQNVDSDLSVVTRKLQQNSEKDGSKDDFQLEQLEQLPVPTASTSGSSKSTDAPPPLLLDTRSLPDAPLVWVSRPDGTLVKMLKCRHCPHLSLRRAEVRDHESMHVNAPNHGSPLACPDCSFTCTRRDVLKSHAEMHTGSLGTVHCLVDENRSDAQQLSDLATLLELPRPPPLGSEPDLRDTRLVHCCGKCPARFLCEKELRIHLRYHSTELAYSCEWCSYAARQPAHLLAHQKAHSAEYQQRTQYLLSLYGYSQRYPPPTTACIESTNNEDPENGPAGTAWIVVEAQSAADHVLGFKFGDTSERENEGHVFTCAKCPARYFKLDALEYHTTLHGSNNRFKCTECDYSSKTAQNLLKHQVVHRRFAETTEATSSRFPSGSDTQFDVLMRGNPNFVYPGYLKNGKLKEKRYKCHKCPSAFEKREQYRVHLTLHGAKQRYRCNTCDYSVKYYANYIQHLKKHQANAQAQASHRQFEDDSITIDVESASDNFTSVSRPGKTLTRTLAPSTSGDDHASSVSGSVHGSNQDRQSMLLMQKKGILVASNHSEPVMIRCQDCPFSCADKETMDAHKRRHGIERMTPPCPHCDYVPRKDENIGEHIRLHFTRLYKPESYLIVELLTLTMRKVFANEKQDVEKGFELLFKECKDGIYLPHLDTKSSMNTNMSNLRENVIVDPNTGEAKHHMSD
ncbi:uncharacterized protein LOC105699667 isoform X2 [Orussus abietinus]|uniref:uncharacterized protein LOC105699667 isoform X2 n=1 Tax=Orussus abietinus TaxID=222816 RepID=UPI0006256167|nr:uncharacterized protein LOC105699667 isoform X2 [Orussus abietinus]